MAEEVRVAPVSAVPAGRTPPKRGKVPVAPADITGYTGCKIIRCEHCCGMDCGGAPCGVAYIATPLDCDKTCPSWCDNALCVCCGGKCITDLRAEVYGRQIPAQLRHLLARNDLKDYSETQIRKALQECNGEELSAAKKLLEEVQPLRRAASGPRGPNNDFTVRMCLCFATLTMSETFRSMCQPNCLWIPCTLFGWILPVPLVVESHEVKGNKWIFRDDPNRNRSEAQVQQWRDNSQGQQIGWAAIVDAEKKIIYCDWWNLGCSFVPMC